MAEIPVFKGNPLLSNRYLNTQIGLTIFAITFWRPLPSKGWARGDDLSALEPQNESHRLVTQKDPIAVLKMPAPELVVKQDDNLESVLKTLSTSMSKSLGKSVAFFSDFSELKLEDVVCLSEVP